MQLIQAKVRSLQGIDDSGWFKPGRGVTLIEGDNKDNVAQILRGLEALNPLYDIIATDPFASYPKTWKQGTYHRPVIKEKKTAVFSVFSAGPELVKTLGLLDDSLFETDRIEFGRRLDYSRWISFVELSASARWRDIAPAMRFLKNDRVEKRVLPGSPHEGFFNSCLNTDRIKGELAEILKEWLLFNQSFCSGDSIDLHRECLTEVTLHERFRLANRVIEEILPPLIRLQPATKLQEEYSFVQLRQACPDRDPVAALLRLIVRRFTLESTSEEGFDRLRQGLSDVSALPLFKKFAGTLAVGENSFFLSYITHKNGSPVAERIQVLAIVAMLTQLLWQDFPVVLLDKYDRDLTGKTLDELADCLKQFGEYVQILAATDRKENRHAYDFATRVEVTTDGLVK